MSGKSQYGFFLGANSYNGFTSLYDEYVFTDDIQRLYILKDGPGCGKSAFMRIISNILSAEGYEVRYIYCSEDPDSLDGLEIPALKTIITDGTSPHILEPRYTGERDFYVDLSRFYQSGTSGTKPLTDEYREKYNRAYLYLAAAGSVSKVLSESIPDEAKEAINRRARGLINRELKKTGRKRGKTTRFYTDAFTNNGLITLNDTLSGLCERLISLDNNCGAASLLLNPIIDAALARGYDIIVCPSPFSPEDIWHLLIPELSLGFVSSRIGRRLHLDKMIFDCMNAADRQNFKETYALREQILLKSYSEMKAAKALNERLEALVNPNLNLKGIEAFAISFARDILL